jgi:hypothetical protein
MEQKDILQLNNKQETVIETINTVRSACQINFQKTAFKSLLGI